jgi:hypothetical protein
MKRLISVNSYDWDERTVIATFRLVGDEVQIDALKHVRECMYLDEILAFDLFKPTDGLAYYVALDTAFANSSRCYVNTVPDDSTDQLGLIFRRAPHTSKDASK